MMIVRGGRWRFFGRAAKNNCGSSSCCWAAAAVAIQGGKATDLVGDGAKKEEQLPLHNTCYGRCVCFLRSRKSPSRSPLFDPITAGVSLGGCTQGLLQRLINLLIVHISCLVSLLQLCRAYSKGESRRP